MTITRFPHGILATPNLGGPNVRSFPGLWTNRILFVDSANGSDGNFGESTSDPVASIGRAVALAGTDDTIYIRPKPVTADWPDLDPRYATYTSTYVENVTVAATLKNGLSIIGTGNGGPAYPSVMMKGVVGIATPTINILGVYTNVENITFGFAAAQLVQGVVRLLNSGTVGAGDAFGGCISNCYFDRSGYNVDTGPALVINAVSAGTVQNCIFDNCLRAISIESAAGSGDNILIKGNQFMGTASNISCDIYITDCDDVMIIDNTFGHAVPSHGVYGGAIINKYVNVSGTCAGHLTGNFFAHSTTTVIIATDMNLSNITFGANWGAKGDYTS